MLQNFLIFPRKISFGNWTKIIYFFFLIPLIPFTLLFLYFAWNKHLLINLFIIYWNNGYQMASNFAL